MIRSMSALALVVALAPLASAQLPPGTLLWGDNFENQGIVGSPAGPYVPGAVGTFPSTVGNLADDGGWDTWYQTVGAQGGISAAMNHSTVAGPGQSLEVAGLGVGGSGCDMVQWFQGASALGGNEGFYAAPLYPTTGTWQLRGWNFVPSSQIGLQSNYCILNDTFSGNSPFAATWITQTQFNHVTMTVNDDQRPASQAAPIVYDQWVEVVTTVDLTNQCVSITYGGLSVGNGALYIAGWNTGVGPLGIANVDLFTIEAGSFWDDLSLTQITAGPQYQTNTFDAVAMSGISMTINSSLGTTCGAAQTRALGGSTVNVDLNTAFPTLIEALVDLGPAVPLGGGGIPVASQLVNVQIPGIAPTAFWLFGLLSGNGLAPAPVPYSGGPSTLLSFGAPPIPGLRFAIQFANLADGLHPDGFSLSQPGELIIE